MVQQGRLGPRVGYLLQLLAGVGWSTRYVAEPARRDGGSWNGSPQPKVSLSRSTSTNSVHQRLDQQFGGALEREHIRPAP